MTPKEFDFFLRIAGKKRNQQRRSQEYNRRQIGQFGIGFLAIFPFGKTIEISSSAIRSNLFFKATIPAYQYVGEGKSIDVEDIQISGFQEESEAYFNNHGTIILISGLSEMVSRFLSANNDINPGRDTINSWSPFEKLKWILQEDLPIKYPDDSLYSSRFKDIEESSLRVWLNNSELFRNVPGEDILEDSEWSIDEIKCKYIIATNWKKVKPNEAQYFKQRLRNVGIGKRTSFSLGIAGRAYSRLHWLTGEIYILEGMDSLLTIDRARFIEGEFYDKFSEYFRSRLSHFALYVESVAEAERDINRQLRGSRIAEVGPKKNIVKSKLKDLEKKGFEVQEKEDKYGATSTPIEIDLINKKVTFFQNHPDLNDFVEINNQKIPVIYIQDVENIPISRNNDGIVQINENYPLFKSGRYGEVLKKILLLSFLLQEQYEDSREAYAKFSNELIDEFSDFSIK